MGRFMDRNFQKCFSKDTGASKVDVSFWQEFRHSLVDYLIQTQPEFKDVINVGKGYPLFASMQSLEKQAGADAAKRMAIELLDRFDCDWSRANLRDQMIKINQERGLMAAEAITMAVPKPAASNQQRSGVANAAPRKGRRNKGKAAADEAAQSDDTAIGPRSSANGHRVR